MPETSDKPAGTAPVTAGTSLKPLLTVKPLRQRWNDFFMRRNRLRDVFLVAAIVFGKGLPDGAAGLRPWVIAGLSMVLAGTILHFVSKGFLRRTGFLIRSGPYRFVRHPFYLANFIVDLGVIAIGNNPFVAAAYVVCFFLIYPGVMRSEETELERIHGDAFRAYRARVPAFLPWKLPAAAAQGQCFSWDNIFRETEISRSLRLLILPAIVYLGLLIRWDIVNRVNPLRRPLLLPLGLLGFIVVGKLGSIALELWSKKKRTTLAPLVAPPALSVEPRAKPPVQ